MSVEYEDDMGVSGSISQDSSASEGNAFVCATGGPRRTKSKTRRIAAAVGLAATAAGAMAYALHSTQTAKNSKNRRKTANRSKQRQREPRSSRKKNITKKSK